MEPWSGHVEIDDEPVEFRTRRRREAFSRIGWVFQTSNLLPRRTALANTMLGPMSIGASRVEATRATRETLALLGIDDLSESMVRVLSGGQAQRVGIARALAAKPEYLFADEPTGQLDAGTTALVMAALAARRDEAHATVIATHDMTVAGACDQIMRVTNTVLERVK